MPLLVDAPSGSWYWANSRCECNCRQVPPQRITCIVESSTKATLEMELELSKHTPEVCSMYGCVFSLQVSGGSWGSVTPLSKWGGLSLVDELFLKLSDYL